MSISKTLGLFNDEEKDADPAAGAAAIAAPPLHETAVLPPPIETEVTGTTPEAGKVKTGTTNAGS